MPVPYSCSGQMLPMPTTSRTICIMSWYWRTNACQRGSGFASANLFGPYCASRDAGLGRGEALLGVDVERRETWSASRAYQTCSGAFSSVGVTVGMRVSLMSTIRARPWAGPGPSAWGYGVFVATWTSRVPEMPASVGSPWR